MVLNLRWFKRSRLKLPVDDDLKFSEKVQNKCTHRMAKEETIDLSVFTVFNRKVGRRCSYGSLEKCPTM